MEAIIHTEFEQQTINSQTDCGINVRCGLTKGNVTWEDPC
jgi:hypothetical protein